MTEGQREMSNEELKLALDGTSIDWFLQRLVDIVNGSDLEFGVTLIVGGSIVSGRMVGGKKYFETFAKEFSDAFPGDARERIYESFAQHGGIYSQPNDENEGAPPQFIHLIDSYCFFPENQVPSNRGVLWRGKINAVSGFSLGQLSKAQT